MTEITSSIRVRKIPLDFPARLDPVVIDGQPEESFIVVGMSLLLPYLEPYLIRSMHAARARVTDAKLLADLEAFNGQEAQHYRQHIRFNEAMAVDVPKLRELEAKLDADYRRFSKEKSLRWNLAYAEGFEAFTGALARFMFVTNTFERMHPSVGELMSWHLTEELEHRTVTFDVYEHVFGGYLYRFFIGLFAQWHLCRFVIRAAFALRDADLVAFRAKYGGRIAAQVRTWPLNSRLVKLFLPRLLATYSPFYTPHLVVMPPGVDALASRYTELALSTAEASRRH